jgi:cellulose synthase/poly-beta-1,6-N-acetylglucosamine synthase-like glycosyltransferase
VIDDGSFDLTSEIAKKFEDKGRLRVIYKENGGKADALNRGIDEALGEYILCMDADSVLSEDVLLECMGFFQKYPDLSAVAGRVEIGNSQNILSKFQKLEYITGLNLFKRGQSFLKTVTIIPGPIGVFKREALLAVGKYDLDTFAEDADLTIRLIIAGHRIKYNPRMVAVTEGPIELSQLITQRYRWSRGMVQAIFKNIRHLNVFKSGLRNSLTMLYMLVESVFIPIVNFSFTMLTIQYALTYGGTQMLGSYFIGLTLLDLSLTLFSMITERNVKPFFMLSIINRVTYGLFLETLRFFAIIDELLGIPMSWGQLKRTGLESEGES